MPEAKVSAMSAFARQLRAWRRRSNLTQTDLGDQIGYSASLVSGIETMDKTPTADFATRCDEVFDTPRTFADIQELIAREAWPSYFGPVTDFEARAARIHEWESRVVPGLLQTEGYARSVISAGRPRLTVEEVDRHVSARLERQGVFRREEGRPMLWEVLHEGVLRHVVGSPEIMAAQLEHLIEVAATPDIVLQVLPYSAYDHPGTDGPILVFDFANEASVAYTECSGGGMVVEQPEQVVILVTKMNLIRAAALSRRESRNTLANIRNEMT